MVEGVFAEPEGVKIAPDGRTVFMTLQETSEIGWFEPTNFTSFL